MSNIQTLPLSKRIITPGDPNAKYGPFDSLNNFFAFLEDEAIDITPCITVSIKQQDGTYKEFWNNNSNDLNNFVEKQKIIATTGEDTDIQGYKILNETISLQEQIIDRDTTYEIRYDFDLDGSVLDIPSGCTLFFKGGSISNATLNFNGAKIERSGNYPIFIDDTISVAPGCDLLVSYFKWDSSYSLKNFEQLKNIYTRFRGKKHNIIWDIPELYIEYNETIYLDPNKVYDFNNATIYAHSLSISRYLFTVDGNINFRPDVVETNYKKISDAVNDNLFKNKQGLIILDDNTPLYTRHSNNQIYKRRDVLLVQNNDLVNYPIFDYDDDPETDAIIKFLPITSGGFKFCNLHFDRSGSVNMAPLLWVNYCYKPEICNLTVDSSHREWDGYAESGTIRFEYVHSPYIHDISMNNCYGDPVGSSSESHVSYNINITGGTNVIVERFNGNARWHSFGNQSINGAVLRDCIVDQWDSHTYGRDFLFENCTFHTDHIGNPEKGYVHFIHCKFLHANTGHLSDSDIATFPIHKIYDGCTFEDQHTALHKVSPVYPTETTLRSMLQFNEYPTLTIRDCILNVEDEKTTYILYEVDDKNNGDLIAGDKICNINIDNLTVNYKPSNTLRFWIVNRPVNSSICINGLRTIIGNDIRLDFERLRNPSYIQIERCSGMRFTSIPDNFVQNTSQYENTFSHLHNNQ